MSRKPACRPSGLSTAADASSRKRRKASICITTLKRGVEQRRAMAAGKRPLDWSAAEALALATLATEGHRVRLQRAGFAARHVQPASRRPARRRRRPYASCRWPTSPNDQAPVEIINSPLSETGVLGFEYGYSLDAPRPGRLGGPIRRLRQRGAGDHRPVPRRGGRSLAPAERAGAAVAARLGGDRARSIRAPGWSGF